MDMKVTRYECRSVDPQGRGYSVVIVLDPSTGWCASVSFQADGYSSHDDALDGIRNTCISFLRSLAEPGAPEDPMDPTSA